MMKRILCLMLVFLLLGSLTGCHYSDSGDILEPVEYFYPRRTDYFDYGSESGVIASEIREAAGHRDDLNYLLSMYLRGPQDEKLRSPFPAGCTLVDARTEGETLYVRLSDVFCTLENAELTLACASLAKTCLALTDLSCIHINALSDEKNISVELRAETLLLADCSAFDEVPATE